MAGTPTGLFRRFAHPLLQEQSGTARQTRQNIHHTIQYRKARSAASQTPSEHRNAQGMVTGGRRGRRSDTGPRRFRTLRPCRLPHQNRTIAIASDLRVDGATSPEIPQKEGVLGSEIAARNRRSLATFHRTLKSQCIIAVSCLGNRAISGVRDGRRNRNHKNRGDYGALSPVGCRETGPTKLTVQLGNDLARSPESKCTPEERPSCHVQVSELPLAHVSELAL